ncbi:MAG TPA: DUF3885 domain-containing protein [Gallionella sp.]|nr:DUF3885 domain-containing protein [Gallionella sp.]
MSLRIEIETVFEDKAFSRPLFYSYPDGLRFELSQSGSAIEMFLQALRKATEICAEIFCREESLVVCLRSRAFISPFELRKSLAQLRAAEITIPASRSLWLDPVAVSDRFDESVPEWHLNIAFRVPTSLLQNLLWCAFTADFPSIRPRPLCDVYLFNLTDGIMVWPYDDRGMDVVGPNHELLSELYLKYHEYLLEYARKEMVASFESSSLDGMK